MYILEQIPGYVEIMDVTNVINEKGFWPSFSSVNVHPFPLPSFAGVLSSSSSSSVYFLSCCVVNIMFRGFFGRSRFLSCKVCFVIGGGWSWFEIH